MPRATSSSLSLLLAIAFLGGTAAAQSDSWPRFRGATNADHSPDTGLLKKWPDDGPNRLWLFDQAGMGYSGFSIEDGPSAHWPAM